ncbi:MAG: histidine phosphatase family protein [Acidimicrobiia bacterium]
MLHTLHLVRHGEVHNPEHVVYADLDGFDLSPIGRQQAAAAADRLANLGTDAIVSSPLDRAVQTADPISALTGTGQTIDDRTTEWTLGTRWAGTRWEDLPDRFPGELEAYLENPVDLEFAPESIADVAARMATVVDDLGDQYSGGAATIVSHQDPIQALRLRLSRRSLSSLQTDKPSHGCVITLKSSPSGWTETASWVPVVESSAFPPVDRP